MLNSLDLLVIVFMVLAAVSLLALCLMFLVREPRIRKVSLYLVAALGLYAGFIGIRIGGALFPMKTAAGVISAIMSLAAIVLSACGGENKKKAAAARFAAAAALVIGMINALI